MIRRLILIAIAIGIPVLWGFAPYGEDPGNAPPKTYASETWQSYRKIVERGVRTPTDATLVSVNFASAFAPLYPSVAAVLLLGAPRWAAARRRWFWLLQGIAVLPLSWLCWFWADFSLTQFVWGAGPLPHYPPLWLLPGLAALAGLAAIAIGIAPRSRFARIVIAPAAG